jgi:uncharacterized protein YhbP (UPF0306 family)
MTAPLAIVNLRSTSRPVATIRYFSDPKKVTAVYDGLDVGVAKGTPRQLAEMLLAYHHDPRVKRVCRTAVISVQTRKKATKSELADIDRRLLWVAADLQKFLRVASMLGWVHGNTPTRHIHLIFANSNGRRTLDLRPKFLKDLQGLQWTVQFLTGRGKGRRKSIPVYTKASKLDVRVLAQMLFNPNGNLREELWDKLVEIGKIGNFRRRNNGEIISFEFQGRRLRLATLKNFLVAIADEESNQSGDNMTNIINPNEPIPDELSQALSDSGFTSEDVQAVLSDIREANGHLMKQTKTVSTPTLQPSIEL